VIGYAVKHGLDYASMLTTNSVFIRGGNLDAARDLAALPGVAYLRLERITVLDPIIDTGKPGLPEAITDWGITDTKANQVWSQFGVRGGGIKVANIDTGVQWNHPALVNQFACPGDPTNAACWRDPSNICAGGSACDNNGHGTHTMGTMVAKDDPALTYIAGMAPDATWIACKGCESSSCTDFALNTCADWLLQPGGNPDNRPNVVNNSWGGGGGDNWYQVKVQAWRASGIFPAFSAGNSGSGCSTLGSPGDYQESMGSAAHDSSRTVASFSSRGPSSTFGHDPYTKPNISAPGVSICSTVPTDGWSCGYSGTSMASPHTAGAVALLWSGCPALVGQMAATFEILQNNSDVAPAGNCSAPPDGQGNYTYGYGYLNALSAISQCIGGTGTLFGHVTDATTGLAIAGALVVAQPAAEGAGIQATTDPNGFYTMILMGGTYNVTASKEEYYSQTANGVAVVVDQTTVQDFALQALPPPVFLWCDDMEAGPGGWSHQANPGTDDWAIVTTQAHSPTHAWFSADVSTISDKRLWNAAPVTIPADAETATLSFWHWYNFESGYDGSVIEISTDGGATWADLGANILTNGYNATLSASYSNPLGGRQAWSGNSNGFLNTKVDLTAYKGMNVQVRFRIGTDSSMAGTGWWIDDVCYSVVMPQPTSTLHLNALKLTWGTGRPGVYKVMAKVRIHDQDHALAGGATVYGTWTLPDSSTSNPTTVTSLQGLGKFPLKSGQTGTYQFCVTNMTKTGYTYDPGANETPDCKAIVVGP